MIAAILQKIFRAQFRFAQILTVVIATPVAVLLIARRDPAMVWDYVRFSVGLSAIASITVAVCWVLFRASK